MENEINEVVDGIAKIATRRAANASQAFKRLMDSIEGTDLEGQDFAAIGALLALEDENFILLAPLFLQEIGHALNNPNERLEISRVIHFSGITDTELRATFEAVETTIEEEFADLSPAKRSFIKEFLTLAKNACYEAQGLTRSVVAIPIEVFENGKIPAYAHAGDAGADLYALNDVDIAPGETVYIDTGISMAIPDGYAVLVQPRSGLSAKSKLRVCNSVGLIDSGYRGRIKVIMENIEPKIKDISTDDTGKITSIEYGKTYHIERGERVAQARLVEVPKISFIKVNSLPDSDRGENGFGSSGKF